ncbi:MAG TPA: hypothetical protein VNU44_18055 [Bryobacteraceae bacterium]|jgi:hypothetical protein|nr:hypothetical protein [Bryobacteraceae bacterium]
MQLSLFQMMYLTWIVVPSCACAADLGCIREMSVPTYSHVARRSATGGTVRAVVTIGPSSKAGKIEISGAESNLAEEVRIILDGATSYEEGCAGKQVELIFTFRLQGDPEWTPPVFVRFAPPNRFIIISRPKKPNLN